MGPAAELARRLAQNAEAVCREYLSNGRREGGTWRVGDIDNTPGRSLMVRLTGPDSGKGAAGRWIDFSSGEHGDLLDLIARTCRLHTFRYVLDEARRFLSLPRRERHASGPERPAVPSGSPEAARRLFASAKPIPGTLAGIYLRSRGVADVHGLTALRFHPTCFYRAHEGAPRETWPALVAAVTDLEGTITGVLRTWLARDGSGKAPLATPRRSLGHLLGHGVRFGQATDVLAAGEGLETMLSLRVVLPAMPIVAALSATHLAAFIPPSGLRRLYVARDNDRVGRRAAEMLSARADADGIEALVLTPHWDDFNTDLTTLGSEALAASLRVQL
ncbi:MAG: toprim domain-containing protein, partial [Hyphomicrobiaceae bacterium]